jgi:hypothetical protein
MHACVSQARAGDSEAAGGRTPPTAAFALLRRASMGCSVAVGIFALRHSGVALDYGLQVDASQFISVATSF